MRILTVICLNIFFLTVHETLFNNESVYVKEKSNKMTTACANFSTNDDQCPCQCINNTLYCCQLRRSSRVCGTFTCSVINVTIISSDLQHISISTKLSEWLGLNSSTVQTLTLSNCTIRNTTFGPGLDQLKILDLRGNIVEAFKEPDISSLDSIYLSGLFENIEIRVDCTYLRQLLAMPRSK